MASQEKELKSVGLLPVVNSSCLQVLVRWLVTPEPGAVGQMQSQYNSTYSTGIMPGPISPFLIEDLLLQGI